MAWRSYGRRQTFKRLKYKIISLEKERIFKKSKIAEKDVSGVRKEREGPRCIDRYQKSASLTDINTSKQTGHTAWEKLELRKPELSFSPM